MMEINWIAILNKFADGVVFGSGFILALLFWTMFMRKLSKSPDSIDKAVEE